MNQEEQEGGGEDGVELDEHQVWGQEPQELPLVYCLHCSHPMLCSDHWLLLSPVALAPACCCCAAAAAAAAAAVVPAAAACPRWLCRPPVGELEIQIG